MADTSNENAMEPEQVNLTPAMEEFHDEETVHTGKNATLTGAEWREIHLLLENNI